MALALSPFLAAQFPGLSLPPSGGNQRAAVTQFIGPAKVTIEYSSPAVHGPSQQPGPMGPTIVDRRGKIWGQLVPYGLTDLGFGSGVPGPWRAGANENTVFETSHDVLIEGQPLPAGRYGLSMIAGKDEFTLLFSKKANNWGSFFYEPRLDALRVPVKTAAHPYREWLTYEFTTRKGDEAVAEMQWEDLAVAWKIKVPDVNRIYISEIRQQLQNSVGFSPQAWVAATQFCLQNNMNLDEALTWADYAIKAPFIGQANFQTLSNKAQVLSALKRDDEAEKLMSEAISHPSATPVQIHQYGRQLLNAKKNKEAMEVFLLNARRFGETWPTNVGLARGYQAMGEKSKALEHARKAFAQAPDPLNRSGMEALIKVLEN